MPVKRRASPKRRDHLPEALQKVLAGQRVEHTTETRRMLRDVRFLGLYRDVLDEADLQLVAEAHSPMLDEWLKAQGLRDAD
jgi:hypothetical protein